LFPYSCKESPTFIWKHFSVPHTTSKISNEWKPPDPKDENVVSHPTKAKDIRTVGEGHGNCGLDRFFILT
jgi:hypothetical protein